MRGLDVKNGSGCRVLAVDVAAPDASQGAVQGKLTQYVLNGNETAGTPHYAARDPRFPQQPTLTDQASDESQFESYRRLGQHGVEEILNFETKLLDSLDDLFAAAELYCGFQNPDKARATEACF